MAFRAGDETVEFEARVEHSTGKARLLHPTMGPKEVWCPKSQTVSMGEADVDGNRTFVVTEWWAKRAGII